mgnify:CR=1 FL=1
MCVLYLSILAVLSYLGGVIAYLMGRSLLLIPLINEYFEGKMSKHIKNMQKWGGFLIAVGLIIKDFINKDDKKFLKYLVINSIIFGLLIFMQPRLIIAGIFINLVWIFIRKGVKAGSLFVVATLAISLFFPVKVTVNL